MWLIEQKYTSYLLCCCRGLTPTMSWQPDREQTLWPTSLYLRRNCDQLWYRSRSSPVFFFLEKHNEKFQDDVFYCVPQLHTFWVDAENYSNLTRPWFASRSPFPLNFFIPSRLANVALARILVTKGEGLLHRISEVEGKVSTPVSPSTRHLPPGDAYFLLHLRSTVTLKSAWTSSPTDWELQIISLATRELIQLFRRFFEGFCKLLSVDMWILVSTQANQSGRLCIWFFGTALQSRPDQQPSAVPPRTAGQPHSILWQHPGSPLRYR